MGKIEQKLAELGLQLPANHPTNPNRVTCVISRGMVYVSGHGTTRTPMPLGVKGRGKVGADVTMEEARNTARAVALQILASVKEHVGDLDRVKRIVRLVGMVNSAPSFEHQAAVIDGASDLFVELWGPEYGRHARAAIGVAELSNRSVLEIMGELELRD